MLRALKTASSLGKLGQFLRYDGDWKCGADCVKICLMAVALDRRIDSRWKTVDIFGAEEGFGKQLKVMIFPNVSKLPLIIVLKLHCLTLKRDLASLSGPFSVCVTRLTDSLKLRAHKT